MLTKKVVGPDGRAFALITVRPDGSASGRVFRDGEPSGPAGARTAPAGGDVGYFMESEKLITLETFLYEELLSGGGGAD